MDGKQQQAVELTKQGNSPSQQASVVKKVTGAGGAIFSKASETAKAVAGKVSGVVEAAAKQMQRVLEQGTKGAGQAVTKVTDNALLRKVSGALKLDWILNATDRVDLEKAEAALRKLQQEHPNESPSQIAHRIMVEKAMYAGGVGMATSLIPGQAAALLAVDLVTTTQMQAEMVYQIAAAYGLNLQDPDRKGEVLAIFGLALGGGRAVKVGLGLLRNVPMAGAVIGASSNAVMLYALGYAACRFYEAKLKTPTSQPTVEDFKEQSENYLEGAIAQQAIVDQILVNMILATNPNMSWEDIKPKLAALNLSSTSLETIAANINSPQPLDTLINKLNRDFALPLLAQCCRIAQMDGVSTSPETQVMDEIAAKFNIDLNVIKQVVASVGNPSLRQG